MIRINLLPVPKARKQERLIIELAVAAVVIAVTLAVGYFVGDSKSAAIGKLRAENQALNEEINRYRARVGEVDKYKQKLQTLRDQLKVIESLQAGRSGPVKVLDELTEITPRRLWITNMKESNQKLNLQGVGEDGPTIADFLESLKQSKYFSNVELQNLQLQEQNGVKLQKFTINLDVKYN
ncbi:MAG: PilN domain-containing protein [Bdellovibrionota bacterium]